MVTGLRDKLDDGKVAAPPNEVGFVGVQRKVVHQRDYLDPLAFWAVFGDRR